MTTRRERAHAATLEEIKMTAWEQIAQDGAAALSLRAISTRMGMSGPALFRYFASRDALVSQLIADAFLSLAEALEGARDAVASGKWAQQLEAVGLAYREWAVAHPERYSLVFLTPLPGCKPAAEVVQPWASRALGVLVGVLHGARRAGKLLPVDLYERLTPKLRSQLKGWSGGQVEGISAQALYLAIVAWTRVHGIVSLELYRPFPPLADPEAVYRLEMRALIGQMGLA